MDVFQLRQAAVDQHRDYATSFVNIPDERVDQLVRQWLEEDHLWSEAALQFNPAYEQAETLGQLTARGVTRSETAACFGGSGCFWVLSMLVSIARMVRISGILAENVQSERLGHVDKFVRPATGQRDRAPNMGINPRTRCVGRQSAIAGFIGV